MKPILKPSTTTTRSTTTTSTTTRSTTSSTSTTTKVDHNPNNIEIGTLNVDHSTKNDGLKDIVDQNLNEIDSDLHKINNNNPVVEQIFDIRALLRHELKNMIGKSQFRNPNNVETQINIETLNVDIGTLNMDNTKQQCPVRDINEVFLGNDDKNDKTTDDVLSNVVKNYYNSEIENDRRKYSGKHKNSPMFIKFVNE